MWAPLQIWRSRGYRPALWQLKGLEQDFRTSLVYHALTQQHISNRYEDRQEDVEYVVYSRELQIVRPRKSEREKCGLSCDSQDCPENIGSTGMFKDFWAVTLRRVTGHADAWQLPSQPQNCSRMFSRSLWVSVSLANNRANCLILLLNIIRIVSQDVPRSSRLLNGIFHKAQEGSSLERRKVLRHRLPWRR